MKFLLSCSSKTYFGNFVFQKMFKACSLLLDYYKSESIKITDVETKDGEIFLFPSRDYMVEESHERRIRITLSYISCPYFIVIGPIVPNLSYAFVNISISKEKNGEDISPFEHIPPEVEQVRNKILEKFLEIM